MRAVRHETFEPPTDADYMAAWSLVRVLDNHGRLDESTKLARVVYAAERARKLLAGIPTCAERKQV